MDIRTDIDIDFGNRDTALKDLTYVSASETRETARRKHQSGVYFHDIPVDPMDGMAVWPYKEAEEKGYFKIDFLNNTIYQDVRDEAHLLELLNTDPPWDLFNASDIVARLAHVAQHFHIIKDIQPKSIEDLAICIALIRPGKKYLVGKPRVQIDREIWTKTEGYYFKRAHAMSYAAAIVVQLNLLIEQAG
jgi:hypothetical protein